MSGSKNTGKGDEAGIAGARTSQFTIKYKAYGEPPCPATRVKKRPSEHIREALDPPLAQRTGAVRFKPSIIKKHNFIDQRLYIVSSVPEDEPLFQPFPPEVFFNGYDPFKKYTTVLQLRNNDKVVRRVQLLSEDPLLTVQLLQGGDQAVYSEIGTSKVACGMEVVYTITFVPESDKDYNSELLAVTDREKFIIPVRCVGLKPMVDVPDEIVFPPTPAKCSYKKNVMINNVGKKKAVFTLKTSDYFAVKPAEHELEPGTFFQCCVYFFPRRVCSYEGELELTFKENGEQLVSKLIGIGTELNVGLSTEVLSASTTYIRRTSHATLQIYNNSSAVAYFLWPKFACKEELDDYVQQIGDYTMDQPCSTPEDEALSSSIEKAFSIMPAKGEVWPGTLVEITVTFCPPKPLRYLTTTHFLISGKSDPIPLHLQGLGVGPLAQFSPSVLDFGDLCLFSVNTFKVSLRNLGELDAHFRLMESLPSSMLTFNFEPDTGTVEPNEVQIIHVKVCGNLMGTFSESFLWEVTDAIQTLSLSFKGRIIRPAFSIDASKLDFGTISYGLLSTKYLVLTNNSPVSLPFSLRIVQLPEGAPQEFTVTPCYFILGAEERKDISVELLPWEERRYSTVISLDIPRVGKDFATIPVQAQCLVPRVTVSCEALDFGTCFIRHDYTKTVSLINESLVLARYDIQGQEQETENVAILRLKAESGFVPAGSCLPLEFTLSTQALGEVVLTAIISISGKEFTHYPVRITAVSVGPTILIERPTSKKVQTSRRHSEELEAWVPALDFGKIPVLKDHDLSLIVRNACCISAPLKISLGKKDSMYHLNLSDVSLDPYESIEMKVRVYMDDAGKFADKITILFEGGELLIPLSAVGVGSTLVSQELQGGFVHLGDQFTLRQFSYSFTVQNMGRKAQTLAWDNDTNRKQKALAKTLANEGAEKKAGGNKKTAVVVPEVIPVFTISPEKTVVKQYSPFSITVTGYTTKPGHVQEDFTCKVTSAKDMYYIKMSVDADMAALTLVFSETTLRFVQNNGWGGDGPHELSKSLTCENVSKLPLSFSLAVKPPFAINQTEWTLPPSGLGVVVVTLEKQDILDRQSTVLYGKLDIMYTGTLERNNVELIAHINYPNLSVSVTELLFGCVVEHTYKRMLLELKNTSALDVWYSWTLDDYDSAGVRVSDDVLRKNGGLRILTNQIFDILPVRGFLRPEEQEIVEFSFYAHPGYQCRISAICEVSGGPQYTTVLEAESGFIHHRLNRVVMDFSIQPFNKIATNDFTLTNEGKVPFDYEIDLSSLKADVLKEVSPLTGLLGPGAKQTFTASVYPGLPEKFVDTFTIQVAYYNPIAISVSGCGAFPHMILDTLRVRTHKYLSLAPDAFVSVYTALQSAALDSARSGSPRIPPVSFDKQIEQPSLETRPEGEKGEGEPDTVPAVAGEPAATGDDWLLETVKTSGNERTSMASERSNAPTVEQVDAELDRLLFREHLLNDKEDFQKFILSAHVCDFGNVTLGDTKHKTIKVTNDGPLPAMFKINMASVKGKGITMDPDRLITLPPESSKSSMELHFRIRTDLPRYPLGSLMFSVPLYIKEGPQLTLSFKAYVTRPVMEISNDHLDFAAVQFGQCKVLYTRMFNRGEVPCIWTAAKPDLGSCDIHDSTAFTCEPETGVIEPHQYVDVKVEFIPMHKKKSFFAVFHVDLMHNPDGLKIVCRGHSYVPIFTLDPSTIKLGPILPNAPQPAEVKYTIVNNADEPVELYSLAFDPDYVKEEEILKSVEGYNERGLLFLDRRNAGQVFWPHLKAGGSALPPQPSLEVTPQPSPREQVKPPQGKGGAAAAAAGEVPEKPRVSHADKLLIMLLGPPAIGKTTQAKQLGMKLHCSVIDMDEAIAAIYMSQKSSATANSGGSQNSATSPTELNDFEKDLVAVLRRKLETIECKFGAIFDGLTTNYATTVSLAKCVFYAAGLEPYDPSSPPDDGKKKGGEKKKPPPPKGKDTAKEEQPAGPVVFPKTFWKGDATVYVITLKAERAELANRYAEIPEMDQSKKKVYVEMVPPKENEAPADPAPAAPPAEEVKPEEETTDVPNYLKHYPYVSVFPSEEELDKYYGSETDVQNLLGGVKPETPAAETEEDKPASAPPATPAEKGGKPPAEKGGAPPPPEPPENKVVSAGVNGLQDSDIIFKQELQFLPQKENIEPLHPTEVFQVVKKPHRRSSFISDTTELRFAFFTNSVSQEEEDGADGKGKGKKVKGGTEKAAGLQSEKYQIMLKRKTEYFTPLETLPEGHERLTRWVVPPQQRVQLLLRFWSPTVGEFEQKFVFEGLNGNHQAKLMCKGVCAEPQIGCYYRHVKLPNTKVTPAQKMQKALFGSDKILDFGPLNTGRTADGFPNVPDSEHCKRLEIRNIGLFDLHADFEVSEGGEAPAAGKKPAAKGAKALFMLNPPQMDLKIDEQQNLNIYCYPPQGQLGPLEGSLVCRIRDNPQPLEYKVICLADTPRVEVDIKDLVFERLLLNKECTKTITIRNVSALQVFWKILGLEGGPKEFTLSEIAGSLTPLCNAAVGVTFKAVDEKNFNQKLKLQIFDTKDAVKFAQELPLSIVAEAYKIDIAIKYPNPPEEVPPNGGFNYGTIRVAQDSMKSLTMDNKGKYKVDFKICCKTTLTQELFTITPTSGTLDPKKQQKVDLHFNKEKKLQKEVALKDSKDVELHIIECLTGRTEQIVALMVRVHAVHSKFQLLPAQGIHFGSQICGTSPPPRVVKLVNLGEFDFGFKLLPSTTEPAPAAPAQAAPSGGKAADKSKKPDKKTGATGEPLELTSFTVIPASGTVLPGSPMELTVYFKADIPRLTSEKFRIDIADINPFKYPGGMQYELSGESCIPGINKEPRIIFYEYHVVDEIDLLGPIPDFGTYSRKDEIFSFGPVIINHEKAAMDATAGKDKPVQTLKEPKEVCMTARFRIENPLRVPCSLDFLLRGAGEAAAKPGGKDKAPAKGAAAGESLCMELFPLSVDIPPLEYRFVTCSFKPLALQKYTGVFEVFVKGQETPQFRCQLQGEGTLPHLAVETPSTLSPLGFPWLQFSRLLVGKSQSYPVVLTNPCLVPAVARLEAADPSSVDWFQINQVTSDVDVPLFFGKKLSFPLGSSETAMVTFKPTAAQQYKQDIQIVVDQNPFDVLTISITGEGYTEEVMFLGLPKNLDDAIWFEDAGVGTSNPITFIMKNTATDKHWRFGWFDVPFLKFTPALGHLHAGSSKLITVTFNPSETVEHVDRDVYLQLCNIVYTGEGGAAPVEWDDTMIPAESLAVEEAKGKGKAPPPPAKGKGKPDAKAAAPELTIESNINPAEPPLEVVKGTGKFINLKLHAIGDNAKYECNLQMVQFKTTMMFQVRTVPFTLKSLSKAGIHFRWHVEKLDGSVDSVSMYTVEPASGVLLAEQTMDFTLKFCPIEVQDCTRFLVALIPNLDVSMKPLRIPVTGQVTRPWCHFELAKSDYAARRDGHFPGPNGELGPLDAGIHIIEFDSLGCNITNVKYFTAVNPTNVSYKFVWEEKKSQSLKWTAYDLEPITDEDVFPRPFKCITRVGTIPGGRRFEMGFEYIPSRLELHESFWVLRIPERRIEVNFLLVGNVKKPELSLDCSQVDFGPVLVGAKVKRTIYLKNPEVGPFAFNFDKLGFSPSQPGQIAVLKFTPSSGIIAEGATIAVELLFSPAVEGEHSFDIICNFRMGSPLYMFVKAEGFIFHEKIYLEGGDDGRPLALIPKEPFRMDYGQVIINSRIYKKLILTNSGRAPFHFMWDCGKNGSLLRAEPLAGFVARDEQLTCDLLFHPTAENSFVDVPIVCQIIHGNKYLIHLNGVCYRPKIKFSFYEFDFGAHFLHQLGLTPPSIDLTFWNEGSEVITCELLYENTSFLEVEAVNMSLSPGQNHTIKVLFRPDAFVVYKEPVKFQICGLDIVTVLFKGEGVPVLLELVDPKQRYLSFGVVRLGKSAKQQVQIINKSKIAAPISFGPSIEVMENLGITCLPKEGILLQSRYTRPMELVFTPKSRLPRFTEGLVLEVAGTKCRILTVSGTCHAVVVKLNVAVLPFDIVTLGSKVTKKIQLESHGDLATNFKWDLSKCKSEFTIFPLEGFLTPRQVSKLDITFHPTEPNPDIRIEGIVCELEGGDPLQLTLLGGCVEQGASVETLKFVAPVRTTETKVIQVKNPTTLDWVIHPVISHEYWTGAVTLVVPGNQTVGYSTTYRPMTMCVPATDLHKGTISFPLPDGNLLSYQLSGEAGPPPPEANIKQEAKARVIIPIGLQVPNWLKASQKFEVIVQMIQADGMVVFKGPKNFEVPGFSKKECLLYFRTEKPGTSVSTVMFRNETSGEFSLFNIVVDAVKADILDVVNLECFVRDRTARTINVKNPLDRPLVFKVQCKAEGLVVPAQLEVPPLAAAPLEVAFRPLVQSQTTCMLVLQSDVVGDFEYELRLRAVPAPPDEPLLFSVSLGNQLSQPFRFKHILPVKATYNCVLSQAAMAGGFTVEPAVVQANPAPAEGLDLQVQVVFEPTRVMEEFDGLLTLKSPEGSDFCCQLLGSCSSPSPQGPFFIKGSGQINFKNVYNDTVQFNYVTDNPAFVVSKGEKMPPKKQTKLVVSYKPVAPNAPKTGRLTVSCDETDDVWLFYLQAV